MSVWAVDSMIIDPVSIYVDEEGALYYVSSERLGISEFDIRGHQKWEIPSISWQTYEDRRAFLRKEFAPERSAENEWLTDLNKDGSHDWKDLMIEKESVFKVRDTDGDGRADWTQRAVYDFHEEITDLALAVTKHEGDLFVGVAPDFWRLQDENGDGIFEKKTSISNGYGVHVGFGSHGMSGAKVGPDGKIYWGIGDIGFNGTDKDGNVHKYPNRGVVVRANPDGSDFEVFAMVCAIPTSSLGMSTTTSSQSTTMETTAARASAWSTLSMVRTQVGESIGSLASTVIPTTIPIKSGWTRKCTRQDTRVRLPTLRPASSTTSTDPRG
jgi:quinoprotein glucose dehydrogenase